MLSTLISSTTHLVNVNICTELLIHKATYAKYQINFWNFTDNRKSYYFNFNLLSNSMSYFDNFSIERMKKYLVNYKPVFLN